MTDDIVSPPADELTCQQFVELVTDYFEGALAATVVERIDAHLAACGPCRTYLDQFRTTIAVTGTLREADVDALPDPVRHELLRAFRAARDD